MKTQIRNVVVISDTHAGCKFALCPSEGFQLDEGGLYKPSRAQKVLYAWWQEFWGDYVPKMTKGEPYTVVHNGDVIDGVHHRSTTQFTQNFKDQRALAVKLLRPVVAGCDGRYYSIRGTEAHVGQSGEHEEAVAKELGAIPNKEGQHSRFDLWKKLGSHLIHFLHHVGTTSSSAHESSAINAELAAEYVEAARWGEKPPSVVIRSHRHRAIEVRIPTAKGFATVAVTPAWQLKTPFAWRIPGARLAPPQLGGMLIRLDGHGGIYTNIFVKNLKRDNPE